jgi:mycofactocin system glycosyltransferase
VVDVNVRYRADSSLQRFGNLVIGGSPLRLFRMSHGGALAVDAMIAGETLSPVQLQLARRLADAGVLHPEYTSTDFSPADVTVVVPAFGERVVGAPAFTGVREVVVVDDASPTPLVAAAQHRLIRRDRNGGPGAARNSGLAEVTTPFVAFVDSDTIIDATCAADWLDPLLAHFGDERVALVAPRVVGTAGGRTVLERYEADRSPLDLGSEPARIACGTRVGYVPAAVIVCRTDALRDCGGFDESLRFGEDVDLVWRLVRGGAVCRYEPAVRVRHSARESLAEWIDQRVGYGSSAAPLAARHPGALAPLRMSGWSALVWGLIAIRRPVAGVAVAVATAAALPRRLRDVPAGASLRLAGLGHLYAGRQVSTAVTRVWWPIAVPLAVMVRRMRWPLAAAFAVPALLDWLSTRRHRKATADDASLDAVRFVALHVADDVAYSVGVWRGVWRLRSAAALVPSFTNWPPKGDR